MFGSKRERSDDGDNAGYEYKRMQFSPDDAAIHQARLSIEIATAMYNSLLSNPEVTTVQLQNAGVAVEAAWAYHNKLIKSIQSKGSHV